jgi:hypothetical protein
MVTDLHRHRWTESFAVGRKRRVVIVNLERSSLNVDQVVAEVVKAVLAGLPVGALQAADSSVAARLPSLATALMSGLPGQPETVRDFMHLTRGSQRCSQADR